MGPGGSAGAGARSGAQPLIGFDQLVATFRHRRRDARTPFSPLAMSIAKNAEVASTSPLIEINSRRAIPCTVAAVLRTRVLRTRDMVAVRLF